MNAREMPAALRHALGLVRAEPPTGAPLPDELGRLPALEQVVMLVGPGVLEVDAVGGLRTFAAAANVGVANTYGAKGVFRWDDPHHLGTCGLQRDDLALLGLGEADLVVTSGLDPDETPADDLAIARCVDLAPQDLAAFATQVEAVAAPIRHTELYRRIAAIAGPGYRDERFPLHPAAAVARLRSEHAGRTVIAEPGFAGLWVGRTFPTEMPGSVVVPARGEPGVALALARVAHDHGLPAVVATTDTAGTTPVLVVTWGDDVDLARTDELVAAAGPAVGLHGARIRAARAHATGGAS